MCLPTIKLNGLALKLLPLGYALCIISWVALHLEVYLDPSWVLPRDNERHFLPTFLYVVEYVKKTGEFPDWLYTLKGGVWMDALSTNYLFTMPHRWFGYALAVWGGVTPVLAYKLALLFGTLLFLNGIYLFARALDFSMEEGAFGVLLAIFSAVTLTFLHQEQALGTITLIPYLGWCALRARSDRGFWILFSILLGLALNFHYPQILFVYGLIVLAGSVAAFRYYSVRDLINNLKSVRLAFLFAIVLGFSVSASPLFYSYFQYHDRLESPLRAQAETLATSSYADYERINRYIPSSLHPANLPLYLNFFGGERVAISELDDNALFMGIGIFWACLAIAVRLIQRSYFLPFTIVALVLATLGTYTFFPRIFWPWVPGISMFRQWYHFSTLLNFHLLFAILFGLRFFVRRIGFHWKGTIAVYGATLLITAWGAHRVIGAVREQMQMGHSASRRLIDFYSYQVVTPKGVDAGALERANRGSEHIQQFNDGRWIGLGEAPVVSISVTTIENGLVRRKSALWLTFLWVMWVPLFVWIIYRSFPVANLVPSAA